MTTSTTTTQRKDSRIFCAKVGEKTPQVISGKGCKITIKDPYTGEVREMMDGMTGAAVGALGWGDEDAVEIMHQGAKASVYQFPSTIGNQFAEELSQFYIDNSAKGAFAAALWTSSGSEANEMALKTIRQYWIERGQKKKVKNFSRFTSYHGFTIGALSLSHSTRSFIFNEILVPETQMVKIPEYLPYHYMKAGETEDEYSERLLKEYEEIILREDPETIASITVETISGSSLGTPVPTKTYLKGLRKLCNKYDIIFHLDEVMCGTGRINDGGLNCWENFLEASEGPDIQTVGKTLGSGYVTIAGLLVSPKVRDVYLNGSNLIYGAQTYSCHAFNCYVALHIQQKIKDLKLTKNMYKQGNYLGAQLMEKLADSKIVGDVRGMGGFWSVEFVQDKISKKPFKSELDLCHIVSNKAFELGLCVMASADNVRGVGGDFIMFAPAFVITKEDVDEIVKLTVATVKACEEQLAADGLI